MGMHITLTDISGIFRHIIPIVPSDIPIEIENDNSDFKTTKKFFRIFGIKKNQIVEWESVFPVNKDYDFVESGSETNGWDIHTFIRTSQEKGVPIRCVITTENKRTIFNKLVSIDKYKFRENGAKDIEYSISLTEFKIN